MRSLPSHQTLLVRRGKTKTIPNKKIRNKKGKNFIYRLGFIFQTQKNVRVYDLVKQEIVKKLLSNSQWISTMAIHPGMLTQEIALSN